MRQVLSAARSHWFTFNSLDWVLDGHLAGWDEDYVLTPPATV